MFQQRNARIKYGFIKTLHNNLISINRRFNWEPEEMMAIGMIFIFVMLILRKGRKTIEIPRKTMESTEIHWKTKENH